MINLASVVLASMIAAPAQAGLPSAPQAASPATLQFDAMGGVLAGISYGIDAVDARPSLFGDRRAASLAAGIRVVSYSCPGTPGASPGVQAIRFDFAAGRAYRLVCMPGGSAEIRPADC
jgi:hypothetical protein